MKRWQRFAIALSAVGLGFLAPWPSVASNAPQGLETAPEAPGPVQRLSEAVETTTTSAALPVPLVIDGPAAAAPVLAVRLETPTTVEVAPPPVPAGLGGQPFAPPGLSNCQEMSFYRIQWGLPSHFDALGWRESNCRNEDGVHTSCCWGYWQLWISLFAHDQRMVSRLAMCDVRTYADVNSDTPLDKQRQACTAKALYDVVGYSAWGR